MKPVHMLTRALCALTALSSAALAQSPAPAPGFIIQTDKTAVGESLELPNGPAEVLASIVTLQPGESTPWHRHGAPMFGYILEGEVTVDYGERGRKTYRQGAGLVEAMAVSHAGTNTGSAPVKILTVYFAPKGAHPVLLGR